MPIATVCDQASQNQAAIKYLIEETRDSYVRRNEEKRNFGFEVHGIQIVPLYDYPHLIKCVRNHLLTKDILFRSTDGTERRGSWKYIVLLYEMDIGRAGSRVCPNLT
ncbi:spermatogenesis-associated 4-related [Holotrichia oblita]|uniref:Spermatogenesis-associated 4-related n=1 Tax=Holotrichia oblita TaxID=644536 RepID=A0ACB9SXF1_HOLOL|nr:spermatogenesis-associated 4-related [Holotrichia oblita]